MGHVVGIKVQTISDERRTAIMAALIDAVNTVLGGADEFTMTYTIESVVGSNTKKKTTYTHTWKPGQDLPYLDHTFEIPEPGRRAQRESQADMFNPPRSPNTSPPSSPSSTGEPNVGPFRDAIDGLDDADDEHVHPNLYVQGDAALGMHAVIWREEFAQLPERVRTETIARVRLILSGVDQRRTQPSPLARVARYVYGIQVEWLPPQFEIFPAES